MSMHWTVWYMISKANHPPPDVLSALVPSSPQWCLGCRQDAEGCSRKTDQQLWKPNSNMCCISTVCLTVYNVLYVCRYVCMYTRMCVCCRVIQNEWHASESLSFSFWLCGGRWSNSLSDEQGQCSWLSFVSFDLHDILFEYCIHMCDIFIYLFVTPVQLQKCIEHTDI